MEKNSNIIQSKSFSFALQIIKLAKILEQKREYVLGTQILKSGTSIGANVEEALGGCTKKEFAAKIQISYKEARETKYWLQLLKESKILEEDVLDECISNVEEILKILAKIHKTTKANLNT